MLQNGIQQVQKYDILTSVKMLLSGGTQWYTASVSRAQIPEIQNCTPLPHNLPYFY